MNRLLLCTALFQLQHSLCHTTAAAITMPPAIRSVDFEVFGRVQGVFFRKFTKVQASNLGLRGWCKNTSQGTVQGTLQGPTEKVDQMMDWLKTKGSPQSSIDKAEFRNDKQVPEYTFKSFEIVKD